MTAIYALKEPLKALCTLFRLKISKETFVQQESSVQEISIMVLSHALLELIIQILVKQLVLVAQWDCFVKQLHY